LSIWIKLKGGSNYGHGPYFEPFLIPSIYFIFLLDAAYLEDSQFCANRGESALSIGSLIAPVLESIQLPELET